MAKNLRAVDNTLILDAIRKNATTDYRRRIPSATQAGVQAVMQNLFDFKAYRNEFIDALVNKIGLTLYNDISWENPLSIFKRGKLEFGATIEEITVGLIKASTYDHDEDSLERELFGRAPVDVSVQYHTINREDKYKNTIEMFALRRAFQSENGLGNFISELMQAPATSDNWDEFLLMTSLFKEVERSGGFHKVQVNDIASATSADVETFSKEMLRSIRAYAGNMAFISTHYNALGMPTAVRPEELVLFITPEANATLDVEALAGAFNIEKADVPGRTVLVPREHFRIPGAQALLTTEKFFVVADSLLETTMVSNAAGLYDNYWLHHHQVMSASLAAPAILFTTDEGTVINIYDDPEVTAVDVVRVANRAGETVTAVERGELYYVEDTVTTSPEDDGMNAVVYTVDGTSQFTRITKSKVLHVGLDETNTTLTITGTSTDDDSSVMDTITVTVFGDRVIYLPPEIVEDDDNDGVGEVTPLDLTVDDDGNVTIPTVTGVQYKRAGVNVANGSVQHITASTVFTAAPRNANYELATGAPASWTLVP
jgi:hypothetical protein